MTARFDTALILGCSMSGLALAQWSIVAAGTCWLAAFMLTVLLHADAGLVADQRRDLLEYQPETSSDWGEGAERRAGVPGRSAS